MKELCDLTGVSRQVVHFYVQKGLLPDGEKTSRNMAYYTDAHVERIHLIRKLQHERFMPLRAIKAMLEEQDDLFSPAQRELLGEVRARLMGPVRPEPTRRTWVPLAKVARAAGVDEDDVDALEAAGLLVVSRGRGKTPRIADDEAWVLETWGALRAAGFTRELGFTPADLAVLREGIDRIFKLEAKMLLHRFAHLAPAELAAMVEGALPVINGFLSKYHEAKIRNLFASAVEPAGAKSA